jgi:hypothetical protein
MRDLPAPPDLRSNLATWAVPGSSLPALAAVLVVAMPRESFDPDFRGQYLETTYLDSASFALRKARRKNDRYLTLRIRCYRQPYYPGRPLPQDEPAYALSAKTESEKFRVPLPSNTAALLLAGGLPSADGYDLLPGSLQARLRELTDNQAVMPQVTVCARRYAVEDDQDRYTLDVEVRTDTDKCLPFAVLEFKSTRREAQPISELGDLADLADLGLRSLKLSKYLWATGV